MKRMNHPDNPGSSWCRRKPGWNKISLVFLMRLLYFATFWYVFLMSLLICCYKSLYKPIQTYIQHIKTYIQPIKTYIKPIKTYIKPITTYKNLYKTYKNLYKTYHTFSLAPVCLDPVSLLLSVWTLYPCPMSVWTLYRTI